MYVNGVHTADYYSGNVSGNAPLMVVFDMATGNKTQNNGTPAQQATLGVGWFRAWQWSGQ